jgi:aspartate racemase
MGNSKNSPLGDLEECVNLLNHVGVKEIIMPCNTAHFFYKELQNISEAPILNMVDLTLRYIAECTSLPQTVCILATKGTIKTRIYERFNHTDLQIVYPEDSVCDVVQKIIYDVKNTSRADETLLSCQLDVAMERIENQLSDVTFLLACTELSVLDKKYMKSHVVIDAMDILALSSIYMAGYKFKINEMNYNEFPLKKILEKR